MEVKQLALEEMRMKSAAWPTKQNGWAESDVLDAVEAQEKRSENIPAAFAASVKKSEKYLFRSCTKFMFRSSDMLRCSSVL